MKTFVSRNGNQQRTLAVLQFNSETASRIHNRRGSVLLVVIGMLGMLLLAGIAFYTFASQESSSAEEFAEASKEERTPSMNAEALFNFGLEQLIIGPESTMLHSALLGGRGTAAGQLPWGRHSILAGILGSDTTTFNGYGIRLNSDVSGNPYVDQDNDGTADNMSLLNLMNYSAAANGGTAAGVPVAPALDTGISSPDINSPYLSYTANGINPAAPGGNPDIAVHIPSFHRPQYRLGANWQTNVATATRVFRPHPSHVCANNPGTPRFLSVATASPTGQMVAPFPFSPALLSQGVWDMAPPVNSPAPAYSYDVDNDGDGTLEGIWMDLDHPVQELSDGRRFVPLFSFTVKDADGLINLNVAGNRTGSNLQYGPPFTLGGGGHISRSNLAASRSEINPQWAMLADPVADAAARTSFENEYRVFWGLNSATYPGTGISRIEMANMDLFHLLHGRVNFMQHPSSPLGTPNYRVDGNDHQPRNYYFGKWENSNSYSSFQYTLVNNMAPATSTGINFANIPQPGQSGGDDDGDLKAGRAFYDQFGFLHPSMRHPYDAVGFGIGLQTGGTGMQAYHAPNANANWLAYSSYQNLSEDLNGNGSLDTEDTIIANGRLDGVEDLNRNGRLDAGEDFDGDGLLDWGEDTNHNYALDVEDLNGNSTLDAYPYSAFPNYLAAPGITALGRPHFNNPINALVDEADESVAEFALATSNAAMSSDLMFGLDEEFGLHGTNTDLLNTGFTSRVRTLAPANFRDSAIATSVRDQFTVSSFDRIQFNPANNNLRSGWEINADIDADGNLEFPPALISIAGNNPLEPIRGPVRFALLSEYNGLSPAPFVSQLRLNMNLFAANYSTNGPIYRALTPHPINPGNAVTPGLVAMFGPDGVPGSAGDDDGNGVTNFIDVDMNGTYTAGTDLYDLNELGVSGSDDILPTASVAAKEFWARRDRQQMARDIYVLLYLLGGGNDTVDYKGDNSARALYTNAQMQEMAQFAVNYVDAMDRDDIITKFEYDRNLFNGWNLGDNPYETADDNIATNDRGIVYGVESQQLTFSEVLGIISRRVDGGGGTYVDHISTQVNDSEGTSDRFYTFMELRSASPFNVDLSTGAWQIAVQDDPDGIAGSGDEQDRVQLTLLNGTVGPGNRFTIGTRGGPPAVDPLVPTNNLPSKFKVDSTGSATPDFSLTSTTIAPASDSLDLDLIPATAGAPHDSSTSLLTDGSGAIPGAGLTVTTAGNFLYGGPGGNVTAAQETGTPHIFVLRRRAHPHRTMPTSYSSNAANHVAESNDNPWIEVDRIVMDSWQVFSLLTGDTMAQVQTKLGPLASFERAQPFTRLTNEADHTAGVAGNGYRANSIGSDNSNSTLPFSLYQYHLDREYGSSVEILGLPLYGPDKITSQVGRSVLFDESVATAKLAQERFLRPEHYTNTPAGGSAGNLNLNNRWYRLLELLEVPSRTHSSITSAQSPYNLRTPGRINLNTLRHRGVLGGLIDDWNPAFDAGTGLTTQTLAGHFNGAFGYGSTSMLSDSDRDWWRQFLQARDRVDPYSGLILPGMAHSRPFRSLNFLDNGVASIDDTVLRSLPTETAANRRGLFEARLSGDLASNLVDPTTRHRLLRKVVNNSTTRSNVFAVWLTVGFFEAIQQPSGAVQIGGPLAGAATHRGFFVVDRSLPEKAYDTRNNRFDFRKFVQYRKTIQ